MAGTRKPRLIVLASSSPRRVALLRAIGLEFASVAGDVDESSIQAESPRALALKLAYAKAESVAAGQPRGTVVIAADTVVALDGEVFGKPRDAREARQMLATLRGRTHQVTTALAVAEAGGACEVDAVTSDVTFRDFTDDEIVRYVSTGEPLDKAGAYGIQGKGGDLVADYRGCFCNVIGLPLVRLARMLERYVDVSALEITCRCEPWRYLKPGPPPWLKC